MYMAYCLHYSLNEPGFELKNTNFVAKVLQHNQFLNERIWIIRYFQTNCQLLKSTIWDMFFKTEMYPLVHMQGLIDIVPL